jgi:hypothetical protein
MLPEKPSTMLGHERPPRRARPDDPGQPGAGDARGRSDAARSITGPDTDSGGDAIDTRPELLDPIAVAARYTERHPGAYLHVVGYSRTVANSYDFYDPGSARFVVWTPGASYDPADPIFSKSLNPDSDPAT